MATFFHLTLLSLRMCWSMCSKSLVPLFPGSILSILRKTVCRTLVSNRCPFKSVQLGFSISSVDTLLVFTFRIKGVFLVVTYADMLLLSIYSTENPVCYGGTWTFKTRIHVYHQGLAFSSSVLLWMLLWAIPGVHPPQIHLRILIILILMLFIRSAFQLCPFYYHDLL